MIHFFRTLIKPKYIGLVIVIIVITTAVMYFAVISEFEPAYESSTSLLVGKHPDDAAEYEANVMLQEVMISEKIVHDIPELVFSSRTLQEVNRVLDRELSAGLVLSEEDYRKSVETEIILYSRVVNVTVRHSDPEGARLVAETIALTTAQLMKEITGEDFIHIISEAERPEQIAGLRVEHMWVFSVLGGILLGIGLVFLLTLSEKYTGSPCASKMKDAGEKDHPEK